MLETPKALSTCIVKILMDITMDYQQGTKSIYLSLLRLITE
jgi:hypothetical protein